MRWPFRRAVPPAKNASASAETPKAAAPSGDAWLDDMMKQALALSGDDERPERVTAWMLQMLSPFQQWEGATSWLGGVPCVPPGFIWPRGRDGVRLHFLAQIDLASLQGRATGLAPFGSLLVFVGVRDYATITCTGEEMAAASLVSIPEDLPSIREIGHWADQPTFTKWPVTLVAFTDDGKEPPEAFAEAFSNPVTWIDTWALARLEADMLLAEIDHNRRQAVRHRRTRRPMPADADTSKARRLAEAEATASKLYRMVGSPEFRRFRLLLAAWRDTAARADPVAKVDAVALEGLFAMRRRLANEVPWFNNLRPLIECRAKMVWDKIVSNHRAAFVLQTFDSLPDGLKPFVSACITGWRGHKLFGLSALDPFQNTENRRGQDLLICVRYDELLKTEMEHDHAISVWCDRERMAGGDFTAGQVIRYSNG